MADPVPSQSDWRSWWIFYIDPTEPQGSGWVTAGTITGPYDADGAIAATVGRMFDQPFWAFALDRGEYGAYYDLHYPPGVERTTPAPERKLGPVGYAAEGSPRADRGDDLNEQIMVTLKRREWLVILGAASDFNARVPPEQGDGGACLDTIRTALAAAGETP